jgi:hypothetical protein
MRNWLTRTTQSKHRIENLLFFILTVGCTMGVVYIITYRDSLPLLLIACAILVLLVVGYKNLLLGLIIAIALMNNAFDLLPSELFSGSFLNKTWDFGFIYFLLITAKFFPSVFRQKIKILPLFIKCFYIFLGVVILSFILSLVSLHDPFIDTFRAFRAYLGYILIPLFIAIFDKNSTTTLSPVFYKLLNLCSYVCLFLLFLYNLQFSLQHQFFFGYQGEFSSTSGSSYLRSIPLFLLISYFFFWQFLAQWLTGEKLHPWKIAYILLSCTATMFTFTRGHYVSILLLILLLPVLLIKNRMINPARFTLILVLTIFIGAGALTTSFAQPFIERFISTTADIQGTERESTSNYRLQLVEDRYKIIQKHGLLWGVGFVHPKYAFFRYGPFKGNYSENRIPTIWCADIAWGNIIYQTGIVGIGTFLLYVVALLFFIAKQLSRYQGQLFILQLACCLELLRSILGMFNGPIYTYQTQNVALILGISAYLHILHCRSNRLNR